MIRSILSLPTGARRAFSSLEVRIRHDVDRRRFVYDSDRQNESYLTYECPHESVMDTQHTVVHESVRGRGIAEALSSAAYDYAAVENMRVLPTCSYLRTRYVPRNAARLAGMTLQQFDAKTAGVEISVAWSGVATLRLTDSRRRNPLTVAVLSRIRNFLRECAEMKPGAVGDEGVRCILIEAQGPVFSSGHDFGDLAYASREEQTAVLEICAEVNVLLNTVPQVTVAAVAGGCYGGGVQLAASCDLVLAHADHASFTLPGARDGGFCHTPAVPVASRVASTRKAFEMAVLCTEVNAAEAEAIGLANRAVPAEHWRGAVDETMANLAEWYSESVAAGKSAFYAQCEAASLEAKYAIATPVMAGMFQQAAYAERMRRFVDRKRVGRADAPAETAP